MTAIGYALVGDNGTAIERVRHASRAEDAGFSFAILADGPGSANDGEPALSIWGVLGAIAQATSAIRLGALVDTPSGRETAEQMARAATTARDLMPGRFFLCLSAFEAAGRDPDRIEAAMSEIRARWGADAGVSVTGHLDIRERRIHALPEPLPPIYLAADDSASAGWAARLGGGLIGADDTAAVADAFRAAAGHGPRIGRVAVCWATTTGRARDLAHGPAAAFGPHPAAHLAAIAASLAAGYDHVYLEQVGPDQAGFLRFAEGELLPALESDTLRLAS